jgi:hypothetical protein
VIDLVLAAVVFPLLLAVGLVALSLVTLAPFVVALQMADTRRFSTTRWGAVALVGSLVGLALAAYFLRSDRLPTVAALLPLLLTWAGPGALWLLTGDEELVGGRAGAHE